MSLKERYPFLATWKRYGWEAKKRQWKADFLPGKPLPTPDAEEEERYLVGHRDWLKELGLSVSEIQRCIAQVKEHPITSVKKLWREEIIPQALTSYFQLKKIQDSLEKGILSRKEASKKLADMFLPSAQGGKFIPSKERQRILRIVYDEILECVKEVRQRCEIRLSKRDGGYNPLGVTSDDIQNDWFPDVLDIFSKAELEYIVNEITPRDACLRILQKRIKSLSLETLRKYLIGKD